MSSKHLRELSDADLLAIESGKWQDVSTEGLDSYLLAEQELGLNEPPPSKKGVLADFQVKSDELKKKGWNNLSRTERLELMVLQFPQKFVDTSIGIIKGSPEMVMRAAPVAIGQKVGELSRIPGAPQTLGAAGGALGEVGASLYEGSEVTKGKVLGAALSGAIRGRNVRGVAGTATEAVRQGAENTAIDMYEKAVDTGKIIAPSPTAYMYGVAGGIVQGATNTGSRGRDVRVKQADELPAYETTAKAYDAGAGRAAGAAFPISPRNAIPDSFEKAVNSAVRRDIGLAETAQLTTSVLDGHLNDLYEPYRRASAISSIAEDNLNAMTEARAESRRLHKGYRASQGNRPDLLDQADEFDALATSFETDLLNEVRASGKHKLAEEIISNRRLAAKTHLAMRANNSARGVVEADEYGRTSRKNPKLLDGDAKLIADTFNSRQNQDFHLGTMLQREVMIAQKGGGMLARSAVGQAFSRNVPSFREYPDIKSGAASIIIKQKGRAADEPTPKTEPGANVRKFISDRFNTLRGNKKPTKKE
jgi:hypothetical protein